MSDDLKKGKKIEEDDTEGNKNHKVEADDTEGNCTTRSRPTTPRATGTGSSRPRIELRRGAGETRRLFVSRSVRLGLRSMSERGLLDALSEDDRRRLLATTRRRRFAAGEVIFHEGDRGDCVYVIERGIVAVRVSTPLGDVATLTMLGSGSAFGELALIDGNERRSATVVAIDATDTRVVDHGEFDGAASGTPTGRTVSRRAPGRGSYGNSPPSPSRRCSWPPTRECSAGSSRSHISSARAAPS